MTSRFLNPGSNGHDSASWRVLLLIAVAVCVPTAGVLWFMNAAIANERLLVRQRLADAYRSNLTLARDRLTDAWDRRLQDIERASAQPSSAAFGSIAGSNLADAAICFDASGKIAYPAPARIPPDIQIDRAAWDRATRLEFSAKDLAAAAAAYADIAASAGTAHEAARALGARSRCLLRAGRRADLIEMITREFASNRFARAFDASGRIVAVDQELLAVQTLGATHLRERLRARLTDYGNTAMPAEQRRFAMRELAGSGVHVPELAAEDLAAEWSKNATNPVRDSFLQPSPIPGVWQMATRDGRAIVLFREATLRAGLPPGIDLALSGPETPGSVALHPRLPGLRIAATRDSQELLAAESDQRVAWHLWIGGLVVAAIAVAGLFAVRALSRQMRVARLKNDLVATVSHELKTPLSSMRLLVDTLLETDGFDPGRTREYLELISRENSRLSRLIDNFLTFSRIERDKQRFEFREVSAEDVVQTATAAMGERLHPPACEFHAEVEPRLPTLTADPDGIVTVIVNLLDNAWKYTETDRRIRLRAFAENGNLCFAVEDNGIGLQPKDRKRIFDRFYQADQRMTRRAGGCGLGLSIVHHIVKAHGGSVQVDSTPGQGSTFTVVLPSRSH